MEYIDINLIVDRTKHYAKKVWDKTKSTFYHENGKGKFGPFTAIYLTLLIVFCVFVISEITTLLVKLIVLISLLYILKKAYHVDDDLKGLNTFCKQSEVNYEHNDLNR